MSDADLITGGCSIGEVSGGLRGFPQTLDHGQYYFALILFRLGTKFGKLILRKIIKIVAAGRHILKLKCTRFDFGWASVPDLAGEFIALPQTP